MANEKRLIDANALIATLEKIAKEDRMDCFYLDEITQEIFDAPTVDAVEVVRCKDCKHWADGVAGCTDHVKCCKIGYYMIGENGYCVYGERKTEDG